MRHASLFIVLTLALLSAGKMTLASATNWVIYLETDDGAGEFPGGTINVGVKPFASDKWDSFTLDGLPADYSSTTSDTKWAAGGPIESGPFVDGAPTVGTGTFCPYYRNYMSTAAWSSYPGNLKKWDLRVAGLTAADTATPIRIMLKSSASTTTLAAVAPTDGSWKWYLKMVNNKGKAEAPANGTIWELAFPSTTSTMFFSLNLPTVKLTMAVPNAILTEGYQLQLIQGVPEPGSLMILGTGLAGLAGLLRRGRRRAVDNGTYCSFQLSEKQR